ncbi:hypothetical protein MMC08_008270 [Hypocenomyce scalaris]|nr:hypothetical protein [Hypocenomyce scalaris]
MSGGGYVQGGAVMSFEASSAAQEQPPLTSQGSQSRASQAHVAEMGGARAPSGIMRPPSQRLSEQTSTQASTPPSTNNNILSTRHTRLSINRHQEAFSDEGSEHTEDKDRDEEADEEADRNTDTEGETEKDNLTMLGKFQAIEDVERAHPRRDQAQSQRRGQGLGRQGLGRQRHSRQGREQAQRRSRESQGTRTSSASSQSRGADNTQSIQPAKRADKLTCMKDNFTKLIEKELGQDIQADEITAIKREIKVLTEAQSVQTKQMAAIQKQGMQTLNLLQMLVKNNNGREENLARTAQDTPPWWEKSSQIVHSSD